MLFKLLFVADQTQRLIISSNIDNKSIRKNIYPFHNRTAVICFYSYMVKKYGSKSEI